MDLGSIGVWSGALRLSLGVSHQGVVERSGLRYERPLEKMASYLDALDAAPHPVPKEERILASLEPRAVVAPEQMMVLETDPVRARAIARPLIDRYLHAPNYTNTVCIQVLTEAPAAIPMDGFRQLARVFPH
jgi:hypothetical protein